MCVRRFRRLRRYCTELQRTLHLRSAGWRKSQFRVCVSRLVPMYWNRNQIFGSRLIPELIQGFQCFMDVYRQNAIGNILKHLGKHVPPKSLYKPVQMAKYKLSDDNILPEAMKQPATLLPAFLCEVLPPTTGL